MSDNTKSCLAFIAVILIGCLLFWLGGYDFNTRTPDVALGAFWTLGFAACAARLIRSGGVVDEALRALHTARNDARTAGAEASATVESIAEALEFLLPRIGSWTVARWDQHLRYEFGDERARPMIAALGAILARATNTGDHE